MRGAYAEGPLMRPRRQQDQGARPTRPWTRRQQLRLAAARTDRGRYHREAMIQARNSKRICDRAGELLGQLAGWMRVMGASDDLNDLADRSVDLILDARWYMGHVATVNDRTLLGARRMTVRRAVGALCRSEAAYAGLDLEGDLPNLTELTKLVGELPAAMFIMALRDMVYSAARVAPRGSQIVVEAPVDDEQIELNVFFYVDEDQTVDRPSRLLQSDTRLIYLGRALERIGGSLEYADFNEQKFLDAVFPRSADDSPVTP